MFKKEFVEKMKNDEELQELRRKVLSFLRKNGRCRIHHRKR